MEIGQKVKIVNSGKVYPSYKELFVALGFKNIKFNQGDTGQMGVIVNSLRNPDKKDIILHHVKWEDGECLISEEGIESYPNTLLTDIEEPWDFVERFYPDYYSSQEIADFNRIEAWLAGDSTENFKMPDTDNMMSAMKAEFNERFSKILFKSIQNYIKLTKQCSTTTQE